KELISEIKDYADIADASYAMLHLIDKNDEKDFFDSVFTPPLWLYADGITNQKIIVKGNKV
ncbi:methyltransferase, partial [Campylobacter sp. B0100352/1]|nr:methyltransferase [Campylobacter sp. B0100352/1]